MFDENVHALLYARVSTQMQVQDGMSLSAQERTLRQAAELAGYKSVELLREEGRSGKSIKGRPVLRDALGRLSSGDANALFVTRIDRLARSTQDFLTIVDHAHKYNWRLVMLDLNLDTSSYQGRFVVTVMSALAEMERGIIAERQKDIHKDRRDRGLVWGKDLGMTREQAQNAFSSLLQTSKPRGNGLGMAIVARVVETHRGQARVRSSPGRGTTISLVFPVSR